MLQGRGAKDSTEHVGGGALYPALGGKRVFEGVVKHCMCLQNASSSALWARKGRWEQAWQSPGRWAGLLPDEKTLRQQVMRMWRVAKMEGQKQIDCHLFGTLEIPPSSL